jgi:hypothetical protein
MPESVVDRCTKAHEYMFLLTKSPRYFYDAEAIREKLAYPDETRRPLGSKGAWQMDGREQRENGGGLPYDGYPSARNKRSVWTVATAPYAQAHFATYPPDLIKPCILAGTSARGCCARCGAPWERLTEQGAITAKGGKSHRYFNARLDDRELKENDHSMKAHETKTLGWQPTCPHDGKTNSAYKEGSNAHRIALLRQAARERGGEYASSKQTIGWNESCDCSEAPIPCTVLDPFAGSGTTGAVALELGRKAILIELNPAYIKLIEERCEVTLGLALA